MCHSYKYCNIDCLIYKRIVYVLSLTNIVYMYSLAKYFLHEQSTAHSVYSHNNSNVAKSHNLFSTCNVGNYVNSHAT